MSQRSFETARNSDDVSLVKQELHDPLCGRTSVKQGEVQLQTKTGDCSVYLPAVLVNEKSQTAEAEKAVLSEKPDAPTALQRLYLDDDNAVLLLVKRLLERQGHKVTCFAEPR